MEQVYMPLLRNGMSSISKMESYKAFKMINPYTEQVA